MVSFYIDVLTEAYMNILKSSFFKILQISLAWSVAKAAQIGSFGNNNLITSGPSATSANVNIDASTLFFLDLPKACDETTSKIKFIAALKKFQNDPEKLKALFHCPRVYTRISELSETDIRFDNNEPPQNVINELQNAVTELRYGVLQIDDDLSFIECVKHLKTLPGNPKFCANETFCTASDVDQFLVDSQKSGACSKDFMKAKLEEMVDVVKAYKRLMRPDDTVPRPEFVAYIQEILNKAPIDKAEEQSKIDAEKAKIKLEARKKLDLLLGISIAPQQPQQNQPQYSINPTVASLSNSQSNSQSMNQQFSPPASTIGNSNNLVAGNMANFSNPPQFNPVNQLKNS